MRPRQPRLPRDPQASGLAWAHGRGPRPDSFLVAFPTRSLAPSSLNRRRPQCSVKEGCDRPLLNSPGLTDINRIMERVPRSIPAKLIERFGSIYAGAQTAFSRLPKRNRLNQVVFCAAVALDIASALWFARTSSGFAFLALIPCSLVMVGMIFNLCIFPWRFSVFGPDKRMPRPTGSPLCTFQTIDAAVGECGCFICAWSLFHDGFAIRCFFGDAWIPNSAIRTIERQGNRAFFYHEWPEVRSPIRISAMFGPKEFRSALFAYADDISEALQGRRTHIKTAT